jgi:hypothetical protein
MANYGIFVGWNRSIGGYEAAAFEVFQSFLGYLGQQQSVGNIENFETVLLEPHGGELNGFVLIRGDRQKLDAIRRTEEWRDLFMRGVQTVDQLGAVGGVLGDSVSGEIQRYLKFMPKK